jgi:SAM-dependent methyltransferase
MAWLTKTFEGLGWRYPTLEELWALMDEPWHDLKCDPDVMDDRISQYYRHPVWLLNGLFIEQHDQSLENRRQFSAWVANQAPKRVADYGGGYGTLARMIGVTNQDTQVDVIEPHPHPAAISLAKTSPNVRYQPSLSGEYDILIATDVFEHVPDPLALVTDAAQHLKPGGHFLIANCFYPVIKCHLPSTFHFRWSWDTALRAMGFSPGEQVCYGRSYRHTGKVNLEPGRQIEKRSRLWYPLIERSPKRLRGRLARTLVTRGQ